ncbi:MAG: alpha/beta hydrolase [Chloroflexota bacterium]
MRRISKVLLVLALLVAGWVAYVTFRPIGTDSLVSVADPTGDPEAALARWAEVQARDDDTIDPRCRSWSLLHDEPVETTVVLLHGYTNCPFMFRRLGNELFAQGWNVIAPRFPYHGYADRLTGDQGLLTAEDLIATADGAIDVATGLGERVVVGGISAGGVTAAWVAQNRPDVDRVVGLAPMMNLRPIPGWFAPQVVNTVLAAPDIQVWWDLGKRESIPPDYGYPKFSSRAVAQLIRLGMATLEQARRSPAAAGSIVLTTNPGDAAVDPGDRRGHRGPVARRWC